jgi:hypothetical protein
MFLSLSLIFLSSSLLSHAGAPTEPILFVFFLGLSYVILAGFLFLAQPSVSQIWTSHFVFYLNPEPQHSSFLHIDPTTGSLCLLPSSSKFSRSFHRDLLFPLFPAQFFLFVLFPVASYLITLLEGWLVSTSKPNLLSPVYTHPSPTLSS